MENETQNSDESGNLHKPPVSGSRRFEITLRLNNGRIATYISYMEEYNMGKAIELAKKQNWLSGVKEIIYADFSDFR